MPDASSAPRSASAEAASRASVAVRWAVGVGAAIMTAIGLVLLFLLTLATNNRALYERNYAWLFGVNVLVAALLLGVLVWIGARLLLRLRKGRFGSRLLVKLAAIFALVGLMPGVLIYVVSYQFVTRSIESWFDVKVEGALVAGVNLARVSLESQAADMAAKTRTASAQVGPGLIGHRGAGAGANPGPAGRHRCGAVECRRPAEWQRGAVALQSQSRAAQHRLAALGA